MRDDNFSESPTGGDGKMRMQIVALFRKLATQLENNEADEETQKMASEFYMKYLFSIDEDIDTTCTDTPEDMMRFLSLGWYIYKELIPRQRKE